MKDKRTLSKITFKVRSEKVKFESAIYKRFETDEPES